MKFLKKSGLILALFCIFCFYTAKAEIQVKMEPFEWSWEANSTAGFQGVILTDGDIPGAEMKLSVKTRLDDSGEILFTVLNGKKLKVRKRSDSVEMDLAGNNEENTFEGEWYLPADVEGGLSYASIVLSVADANGKELIVSELQAGIPDEDQATADASLPKRLEKLIKYLLISGVAVWLFAFCRFGCIRRIQMKRR